MSILAEINALLPPEHKIKSLKDPTQGALADLLNAAARLDEDTWNTLSEPAQLWFNAGVRAVNTKKTISLPPESIPQHTNLELEHAGDPMKKDKTGNKKKKNAEQDVPAAPKKDKTGKKDKKAGKKDKKAGKKDKGHVDKTTTEDLADDLDEAVDMSDAMEEAAPSKVSKKITDKAPKAKAARAPKEPKVKTPRVLKKGGAYYAIKYWLENPEATVEQIMEAVKSDGVEISKSTLQVLLYDARIVVRVQADLEE